MSTLKSYAFKCCGYAFTRSAEQTPPRLCPKCGAKSEPPRALFLSPAVVLPLRNKALLRLDPKATEAAQLRRKLEVLMQERMELRNRCETAIGAERATRIACIEKEKELKQKEKRRKDLEREGRDLRRKLDAAVFKRLHQ